MLTVEHLTRALANAIHCSVPEASSPQSLHHARSAAWVGCLARELKASIADPEVRVFHKGDAENRADFGLNELLYDVCVCKTATSPSARGRKTLRYITKALWLVESEFARDSGEAVKDFNKLVIGSAENKLFIGPRVSAQTESAYLDALLPVAGCCGGNVYVALVPHPADWGPTGAEVALRRFAGGVWQPA